jgi:histone-lysine N-methyltransferase SETD3
MPKRRATSKKAPTAPADESSPVYWKDTGNAAYAGNDFSAAVAAYGRGIALLPPAAQPLAGDALANARALHSNRSMALIAATGDGDGGEAAAASLALALQDAERCVALGADWLKGHYRLGCARLALGKNVPCGGDAPTREALLGAAQEALRAGLRLAPDDASLQGALVEAARHRRALTAELSAAERAGAAGAGAAAAAAAGDRFSDLEAWMELSQRGDAGGAASNREAAVARAEQEEDEEGKSSGGGGGGGGGPSASSPSAFPKLYMEGYSEQHRGVHALVNIADGEEILAVPKRFLLTVEMGKAHPVGQAMLAAGVSLVAVRHSYLAVFVLMDRLDPASFFQPFYRVLPGEGSADLVLPNMPVFWGEEELAWLEGSFLARQIADRKVNIGRDYAAICACSDDFAARVSPSEFKWARMLVASRNFGVSIDGVKTDALVPYADMLNHLRPRETTWQYEPERELFTIRAAAPLAMGAQIYDSYGKKCNSRFLLNYGFSVEQNTDPDGTNPNEVRLVFELTPENGGGCSGGGGNADVAAALHAMKLRKLDGSAERRAYRLPTTHDFDKTRAAFSFLRFVHADTLEQLAARIPPSISGTDAELGRDPVPPLSCANEAAVLSSLAEAALAQLELYPTSLQEDYARLEDEVALPPFSNARNAAVHVRGEKEVMHFYLDLAAFCVPLLHGTWEEAKPQLVDIVGPGQGEQYIRNVVARLLRGKMAAC